MFEPQTVSECIELVRATYRGRTYVMGLYKDLGDGVEELVGNITGDAYRIYSEQLSHDLLKDRVSLWPLDGTDLTATSLMEVIWAVPLDQPIHYNWELDALHLLNQIVAEVEDK